MWIIHQQTWCTGISVAGYRLLWSSGVWYSWTTKSFQFSESFIQISTKAPLVPRSSEYNFCHTLSGICFLDIRHSDTEKWNPKWNANEICISGWQRILNIQIITRVIGCVHSPFENYLFIGPLTDWHVELFSFCCYCLVFAVLYIFLITALSVWGIASKESSPVL